jgi:ribosomal protein S1
MSHRRIRSAEEVVKEGDTVRLVVLSVDPVARRMSFSLKQATPLVPPDAPIADAATPAAPAASKKKRPPLRGGLDF